MKQAESIIGQLLGHYRVLEQIGAGGMGMVFRASDEQLERDVAIKILPPGMLAEESARKRFRREALTLAKLNHPNIGTVYEFGSQDGLDFLVMEYVGGVAVDAKLAAGPVAQKDLLRLGFQLADGLASAHEHGVIHRDLKPANLRLTQDNRLKILDFGLAQFVRKEADLGASTTTSEDNKVSGTLPYMSPEQLRGEITDQRTDIWSAGVVLYELAAGRRPFAQSQVSLLIDAILNRPPQPPSVLNPKIAPGLEMVILKCLDQDPERRYQSARELRVDLDRLTMPISGVTSGIKVPVSRAGPTLSRTIGLKALGVAGAMVVAIVAAGLFFHFRARPAQQAGKTSFNRRRAVAVLPLKNATSRPEAAWLSTGLPEMLRTELGVGEQLRMITGDQVAQMKMNLSLADSDSFSSQTLSQIGKFLGADLVVAGSYAALADGKLRVDLHLQDIAGGETVASVAKTGDEKDIFDLISAAGAELRAECNIGDVTPQDQATVRASLSANPEGSKLYAEGLAKLRVNDAIAARDLLRQAVEADPAHSLAHSALADAWSLLGYDEQARLSAKSAYDLSAALGREDKLLIEARYREASKEWDNAAEDYRTLFGYFPDNLEYGLLLSRVQARGGKGKEALATVDSLRRLPPPLRDDPRIDLAASEASKYSGDLKNMAAFAGMAAQKARALNAKLVVARALYLQGAALEMLGDPNGAMTAVDEARSIYEAVGDRYGLASVMEVTGLVFEDRGDYPGALAKFKEELEAVRAIGNRKAEGSALNYVGLVMSQQGHNDEALTMYRDALSVFRELSDKGNSAQTLVNIAGSMKDGGDLKGAKTTYDQALALAREISDQNSIAVCLTGLGTVLDALGGSTAAIKVLGQATDLDLASGQSNPSTDKLIDIGDALQHLGDIPGARTNYDKALELARAAGDKDNAAYALAGLGSLDLKSANLVQAHKDYDEALSLRKELGEKDTIAITQVGIAELSMEEGYRDSAEPSLREARDELQNAHKNDDLVTATAMLTTLLLKQGKTDAAGKELAKVAPIASKTQNLSVQLAFATARARAKAASHDTGAATAILKDVMAKATKSGYLGAQFEARLALEELEVKSGKSAAVRSRLEQLQKEAKDKGFDLISRKAAAL